jgi:hypothetical protein
LSLQQSCALPREALLLFEVSTVLLPTLLLLPNQLLLPLLRQTLLLSLLVNSLVPCY